MRAHSSQRGHFKQGEAIFVYPDKYYPIAPYSRRGEYEIRGVVGIYNIDLFSDGLLDLCADKKFFVTRDDKSSDEIIYSGQAEGLTNSEAHDFVNKMKSQGMILKSGVIFKNDLIYSTIHENYRTQKELIFRELIKEKR